LGRKDRWFLDFDRANAEGQQSKRWTRCPNRCNSTSIFLFTFIVNPYQIYADSERYCFMLPDAASRIKIQLSKLQCELESLNQNITSVDSQILYTEKEVVDLEQQLRVLRNSADSTVQIVALEIDLAAKRRKEELLRLEKAQLRTEKAQLRTEMRQGNGAFQ
jgi:hypothetical protein